MILRLLLRLLEHLGAIKYTFGFSEPGVPVIPTASPWMASVNTTQSGTLTSGSVTVTSLTATGALSPGQAVTGTGVPNGTYIATIVSGTSITLSQAATATGAQTLTFYVFDANQSQWAGNFPGFAGPVASAIATDAPDCPFNIPDVQALATTVIFVPAPGRGLLTVAAGTTTAPAVQYNINGTWTSVVTFPVSATNSAYIMCDGVNVRFNNLAATTSTFTFYRERSSKSTSI